ncbi:insulin-degrading enzyme-like protein [Trifolium pratense]|uniref:Insulin-degrading enzyme-like protein n=1 Tax=Trifolium pratense TaxID=57577 RepID=A0A2K3P4J9_TRIPR|nr:insulin-degrading enzyme-like protein [Trifolium pratense]
MKPFPFCTKAVSQSKKRKRRLPRSDDEALVLPSNPPFIWTPGQKYYVKASDGSNILEVSWALPSLRKVYEHKPEKYVSYLLNQEGEGSLISLLKNKGWILSFKSRVGDFGIYRTSKDYIFIIEIHLTDYGLLEVNNIIGFLYGYLHFLRDSPQEWIFKEIQTIRNMKFNFKDENQLDYASRLSENMLFYPPEHIISANYVCKKWDEEMIKQVIGYLIPDNMRVDHLISDFTRKADEQRMKFWYKKDIIFKIRRTSIFIRINFKEAHDTDKNSALSELFLSLLHYRLSEVKFKAKMSMCEITLRSLNGMLELNVFGFNGMLHKVLSEILFEVGSFKPADDIQYKVIKQDLERDLSNNGNHILELLLHEHLYMNGEMLRHLDQLLLDDFRSFIEDMRSQKNLQGNGLPIKSRYAAERVICLPSKANIVMSFRPASEIDTNSVAELYFQIGEVQSKSVKLPALLVLFDDVVRDGFFQKMRELENLGYTATSSITTRLKVVGYSFKIVSDKHDPYYLQDEMEKFIDHDLGKFLRDLDHQTFEDYKNSAAEELSGNFPSLKEESEDLWTSITIYRSEIFDVDKKMAEELRKARKKDLIEYYRKYFKSSYPDCRRVKINTVGYGKKMSDEEGKDMSYFKNKYDFYKC